MTTPVLSRRELFAVTGGAVVAAGTVAALKQGAEDDPLAAMASGRTVVLQDRRLPLPEEVRARLGEGVQLLTLEQDPVRMWRGEHAAVLQDSDTRLLGVTPWIEFVMIRGLAAESRKQVRYQRFDADSNAMVWLIS